MKTGLIILLVTLIFITLISKTLGTDDERSGYCSRGGEDCEALKSMDEELEEVEHEMYIEETILEYNERMLQLVRAYSDEFETDVAQVSTDAYTILTTMYKNAEKLDKMEIFKSMRKRALELTVELRNKIGHEEYRKYTDLLPALKPMNHRQ